MPPPIRPPDDSLMTTGDRPLAHQLAADWVAIDPAATPACLQCGKEYPIIGVSGLPNMACPHCGLIPNADQRRNMLNFLEIRRFGPIGKRTYIKFTTEDHPLAHELAGEWLALNPKATHTCNVCNREIALASLRIPTMACPHCGFIPDEDLCRDGLKALEWLRPRPAARAAPAERRDAPLARPAAADPQTLGKIGQPVVSTKPLTTSEHHPPASAPEAVAEMTQPDDHPLVRPPDTTMPPADQQRPRSRTTTMNTVVTEKMELIRRVIGEWHAFRPEATPQCDRCRKRYRLLAPDGTANVACPYCGATWTERYCHTLSKTIEEMRARHDAGERTVAELAEELAGDLTEVARAAVGSEPSVVRIRCRCSNCGAASEAPPCQAGQDEVCPECGRKLTAADRLAAELIAFNADAATPCRRCKTRFPVMQFGMTCPHCGDAPSEQSCEAALKHRRENMGDWRKIKRLNELLSEDSAARNTPRFICPFCRAELPPSLAERNFARVWCPRGVHDEVYIYNGEAFHSSRDCERVLEFRLEKRKKAQEKARQRELAAAAKEIATETQPDRGQANGGYVYALLNSTMPGLVKIGKTQREPDERAKELSAGTGTPTPFLVAYAEWFKDCSSAETYVHALLEQKGFRVAQNREFFSAPIKAAIQAIMKAKEREDRPGDSRPETGETE